MTCVSKEAATVLKEAFARKFRITVNNCLKNSRQEKNTKVFVLCDFFTSIELPIHNLHTIRKGLCKKGHMFTATAFLKFHPLLHGISHEFRCSTCIADASTVMQRSLWGEISDTLTVLYCTSEEVTNLYGLRSNTNGTPVVRPKLSLLSAWLCFSTSESPPPVCPGLWLGWVDPSGDWTRSGACLCKCFIKYVSYTRKTKIDTPSVQIILR